MDYWKTLPLLLAGSQGILLSMALMFSNLRASYKKQYAIVFLGLVLWVCSIELLNAGVMPTRYHSHPNAFPFWLLGTYWLIPVSLWLFFQTSLNPDFVFTRKHWFTYVPALIEILTEFSRFYLRRITGHSILFTQHFAWFIYTEVLPMLFMIGALVYYGIQLKIITGRYWHIPEYRLHLIKQYVFFSTFGFLTLLWVAEVVFQTDVYRITKTIIGVFLLLQGYVIYFQPDFFTIPSFSTKPPKIDATFSHYEHGAQLSRMKQLLDEKKIYLKPRLTLEDLATQLNLPERYVSYLLNTHLQTNFNSFINTYRVKEAIARIQNPEESHKTLLGIALDSGFSSKSSFNQIFKSITGESPSSFLTRNTSRNTILDVQK